LSQHLPRKLFDRPKMGFAIPIENWLDKPLMRKKFDPIFYESDWNRLGYESREIKKYWENYKSLKSSTPQKIWTYAVAGLWLKNN